MSKVENRIQQLVKHSERQRGLLDLLLAEFLENESKHKIKVDNTKDAERQHRLAASEEANYKTLCEYLKTESPLGILVRLLRTEKTENGWRVLGSGGEWYEIPEDLSSCQCPKFSIKQQCPHLDGVRLMTRLRYGSKSTESR